MTKKELIKTNNWLREVIKRLEKKEKEESNKAKEEEVKGVPTMEFHNCVLCQRRRLEKDMRRFKYWEGMKDTELESGRGYWHLYWVCKKCSDLKSSKL